MVENLITDQADGFAQADFISVVVSDLNGVLRCKRLPGDQFEKLETGEVKMPLTLMGADIWGHDVFSSGQVFETGDKDGICRPTGRGLLPVGWGAEPTALAPVTLCTAPDVPYTADPRNALAAILSRYFELGLTPVCAVELEFYLFDPARPTSNMGAPPQAGGRGQTGAIYSLSEMEAFGPFLRDVYAACRKLGIPAQSAIAESGCGQFEINFHHVADALRAADDAIYFKYLVKGIAQSHGMGATFMAKPFGGDSGSGMHVHFSVLDAGERNIFDNGGPEGSALLGNAVAGLLASMADMTLVFAPHYNSYRRLRANGHAPVNVAWGYENRTTAIRIPDSAGDARRIEHRVAGADANPYLVLAAILGGALDGIERKLAPSPPHSGNAYDAKLPVLLTSWEAAIDRFAASDITAKMFGATLRQMFVACKRQELEGFADVVSPLEYDIYLDRV